MGEAAARPVPIAKLIDEDCRMLLGDRASLPSMPDVAIQDIGVLPILNVLKPRHTQLRDEAPVLQAIERFAATVGTILLTRWGFEDDLVAVAKSRRDWSRNSGPKADLADLVLIARLHAGVVWGSEGGAPRLDQVPAFSKLPLGELCDDGSLEILRDDEPAIQDVLKALGAT